MLYTEKMLSDEYLDALEAQTRSVMESAERLVELIGIVRRMVTVDRQMAVVKQEPEEVKQEPEERPSGEDWEREADQPPFYLPTGRTVTYTSWSVRCPACGGRPSRCPCS